MSRHIKWNAFEKHCCRWRELVDFRPSQVFIVGPDPGCDRRLLAARNWVRSVVGLLIRHNILWPYPHWYCNKFWALEVWPSWGIFFPFSLWVQHSYRRFWVKRTQKLRTLERLGSGLFCMISASCCRLTGHSGPLSHSWLQQSRNPRKIIIMSRAELWELTESSLLQTDLDHSTSWLRWPGLCDYCWLCDWGR